MILIPAAVITLLAGPTTSSIPLQDTTHVAPSLTIGTSDGADAYIFGFVSGIAGDARGQIFVSDMQLARVQIYDSTGQHIRSVGRRGLGPGEMQRPLSVAYLKEGEWVLADLGLNAYLWFEDGGAPIARHIRPGFGRVADRIEGNAAGDLIDSRRSRDRGASAFYVHRIRRAAQRALEVDSVLVPSIPETGAVLADPSRGIQLGHARTPFTPYTVWTATDDGVAFTTDGSYVVQVVTFGGGTDTLFTKEDRVGSRIPSWLAEEVLAEPLQRIGALAVSAGVNPRRWTEQLRVPEFFPQVLGLFHDPFGRIWVLGAAPSGKPSMDVWTQDGVLLGTMVLDDEGWPDLTVDTIAVSGTHVLAVFRTEFGVHQVRGFAIPGHLRRVQ